MKPTLIHALISIASAIAATLLSLTPASVFADDVTGKHEGNVVTTSDHVVRGGFGLCWRSGYWTEAMAAEPCDGAAKTVAIETPAPQPVVVVAIAPVAPAQPAARLMQKISFSGDALFAFDKSELKPEGKAMLDGLVAKISGASYDTITVTGYTDRFGTESYNMKLSERRAQTVKDYLLGMNVRGGTIEAEGKGKSQAVTNAADCRGAKSARVIACLQPDRRVDIELTGATIITGSR